MSENQVEKRLAVLTAWVTAGLAFILMSTISVMAIMVWQAYRVADSAAELRAVATDTHNSLCAFKNDLDVRYKNGVKFLRQNPDGIPGISALQIQQSLSAQKSTLDSLSQLDCG